MRIYEVTVVATIEVEDDAAPDNGEFYLDFNNNLPYSIIDESVDIREER
jgi:hypothetical protein